MGTIFCPVDAPTIDYPASVHDPLPGWRWGCHVSLGGQSGSGHYMIRNDDDATVIAIERPDLAEDNAPSEDDLLQAIRTFRVRAEEGEDA